MFYKAEPDELLTWFLAFRTERSPKWWLRLIVRGRFTHVCAFAAAWGTRSWVFIEPGLYATRVLVAPDGPDADRLMAQVIDGAQVLKMRVRRGEKFRLRPVFCCTSAIRHLLNMSGGALSVDALWRDCLAQGAEIVANGERAPTSA